MSGRRPPAKREALPGFVTVKYIPCPDCRDNELGGRRVTRRGPVFTQLAPDPEAPGGCANPNCHSGEIKLDEHDPRRIDPYARKK